MYMLWCALKSVPLSLQQTFLQLPYSESQQKAAQVSYRHTVTTILNHLTCAPTHDHSCCASGWR